MSSELKSKSPAGSLMVVATPIGNLGDMTFRAVETLKNATAIYCEDTRTSRVLLSHYGITVPLLSYHEHNAETVRPEILARLEAGDTIALISDAGTPLISDPGYKLVREAQEAGFTVTPIPGACALTTALCAAGLPTDSFLFAGFLPTKSKARSERLQVLMQQPHTLILYESPHRLIDLLEAIAQCDGTRDITLARELTKRHEEIVRGPAGALLAEWSARDAIKGELVVLIAPAPLNATQWSDEQIDTLLRDALSQASVKDAAAQVATITSLAKSDLYARALKLKQAGL